MIFENFWDLLEFLAVFFGGVLCAIVFNWLSARKALSISRAKAAVKFNEAKKDNESRLMEFLMEVKAAYDIYKTEGGTDIKEFGLKKLPSIALKYPDVIMRQGRQLMKLLEGNDMGGLEGFLGL